MESQHLILFDGTCGLCHRTVKFLIQQDKHKIFVFAPLQGETAAPILQGYDNNLADIDSLILVENYKDNDKKRILTLGKGTFRIYWLLGGLWKIPGSLSFLPSFLYDWAYRFVARNRFKWFERPSCLIPTKQDSRRFLP